jgi:hypothetical protein
MRPSKCTINTSWQYNGLQTIRMENDCLSLLVFPQLGAKIYEFVHKPSGTNLLWANPRLAPGPIHYGMKFDDNWSGGWDELIPNDMPIELPNGDILPDHGEVWSQASEWRVVTQSEEEITVSFNHLGRVLPTRFEKVISLRRGESFARLHYSYTNQGPKPIHFLWNIHPPLTISTATRLDLPARRGFAESWGKEQFEAGLEYAWPYAPDRTGRKIDLRIVPSPAEAVADMHYLPGVAEGWYAVTDTEKQVGFGLVFPNNVLPHLWLFRAIGGWRGLNTLIVEVSTGYPTDLREAVKGGHCGRVAPGEAVHADVLAVAYSGVMSVERIDATGKVIPQTPIQRDR